MNRFSPALLISISVAACAAGEVVPTPAPASDAGTVSLEAGAERDRNPLDSGATTKDLDDGGARPTRPRPPTTGEIVFVELMVNPSAPVTDDAGEWIELVNVTDASIDLEGCVLDDDGVEGNQHVIANALVVAPRGLVVLAKRSSAADNGGVQNVEASFGAEFSLANGGGKVSLVCNGDAIDVVEFDPSWPYAEGVAMQLSSASQTVGQNDDKTKWCAAPNVYANGQRGSPGIATDHCP